MTEHWHAISSGEAFQLASTLSVVLNLHALSASPAARWRRPNPFADETEQTIEVSFDGLTREEQDRAVASFAGGRRFVIADMPARG